MEKSFKDKCLKLIFGLFFLPHLTGIVFTLANTIISIIHLWSILTFKVCIVRIRTIPNVYIGSSVTISCDLENESLAALFWRRYTYDMKSYLREICPRDIRLYPPNTMPRISYRSLRFMVLFWRTLPLISVVRLLVIRRILPKPVSFFIITILFYRLWFS